MTVTRRGVERQQPFIVALLLLTICLLQETHAVRLLRNGGKEDASPQSESAQQQQQQQQQRYHRRRRGRRLVKEIFPDESDDDICKVLIGYNSKEGRKKIEMKALESIDPHHDFGRINAVAVRLTKKQLLELEEENINNNGNGRDESDDDESVSDIAYFEKDYDVQMLGELVPYGIRLSDGLEGIPSGVGTGNCSDPNTIKVAIVDSGIDGSHKDLACSVISGGDDDDDDYEHDSRCMGKTFGGTSSAWYVDTISHGTHVAGTISAIGQNDLGVRGMVSDGKICLLVAKVFDDTSGSASLSTILDAVQWAINEGAMVINLSLGGPEFSETAEKFYEEIFEKEGRIVVAAAGNNGLKEQMFPASYDSVLSVTAIDENEKLADFSSYGFVDFSAPGLHVLSTIPEGGRTGGGITVLEIVEDDSSIFNTTLELLPFLEARLMEWSAVPPTSSSSSSAPKVTGLLTECLDLGKDKCPSANGGDGGHICVIERGDITFDAKAQNCEASGGAAAVIYNNEDGHFIGTLTPETTVKIPVVGVSREVGETIIGNYLGQSGSLIIQPGYGYADGTSMAAPHVTGAIAASWRPCLEQCTNKDIVECFQETAKDLGDQAYFGYGLIQTKEAFECLRVKCGCYQVRRIRERH